MISTWIEKYFYLQIDGFLFDHFYLYLFCLTKFSFNFPLYSHKNALKGLKKEKKRKDKEGKHLEGGWCWFIWFTFHSLEHHSGWKINQIEPISISKTSLTAFNPNKRNQFSAVLLEKLFCDDDWDAFCLCSGIINFAFSRPTWRKSIMTIAD